MTEINNEAKVRRPTRSEILGTARVVSYEDLEKARAERAAKEAAKEAKKAAKETKKVANATPEAENHCRQEKWWSEAEESYIRGKWARAKSQADADKRNASYGK